ncbi:PREDICTED: uncharacterized protein LOC104598722 [Nelumbo nucifera]|uniref:Uncharacterized protein LOC104598722 n=1 Tax=Nelumbo nucifera TaxID=4432 RepID=A0A1U8A330_NELNU|nr:PREDICTED: uncharacterized protein LOC104598722 [Nelumbo nucifera]
MSIKQKQGESLRSYIDRFKKEELEVRDLNPMVSMHTAINGLCAGSALKKAQKYIAAEEASAGEHQEREAKRHNGPPEKKRKGGDNPHHNSNSNKDNKKPPALALAYKEYTPLNSTCTQILMQIGEEKHLKQFVGGEAGASSSQQHQHHQVASVIDVISRGLASARKAYARQLNIQGPSSKKQKYLNASKEPSCRNALVFTDEDLKGVTVPHDDALVVAAIIANYVVKKILVDSGSSADILFYNTFERMNLTPERLQPADVPLIGFSGNAIKPKEKITLPITIGNEPDQVTWMHEFLVVKVISPYNAIMGRPTIHVLRAAMSSYHLALKFPTEHGVEVVRGNQQIARQCYVSALKGKNKEALSLEGLDLREETASRGPRLDSPRQGKP